MIVEIFFNLFSFLLLMSYLDKEVKDDEQLNREFEKKVSTNKIVFLGLSQSGKTSIIKTVFEGRAPEDTINQVATVRFERMIYDYKDYSIFTYDVGGQISYLDEAIEVTKEEIFTNVKALIFVVDASNIGTFTSSRQYLLKTLRNIYQYSENPGVFIFAHKMDLIKEDYREEAIRVFKEYFDLEQYEALELFETSIYDDSTINAINKILSKVL